MKKSMFLALIILPVLIFGIDIELNLSHLEFLRDEFDIEGNTEIGYWIYADRRPDGSYKHIEAPCEGATCVDDVARAALLYLRLFETSKNELYYIRAREALDFLLSMQDSDGDFYNFVFSDGSINRNGPTSRKGGNWWAARGLWALSVGSRVLSERDASYSTELAKAAWKTFRTLLNFERNGLIHGYTDISSVALLGAIELYAISNDIQIKDFIERCASALKAKLIRDSDSIFQGFVDENALGEAPPLWHGWGSRQLEAMALASVVLENDELLALSTHAFKLSSLLLLSAGPIYSMSGFLQVFPQIAYAAEAAIGSGYTLFELTGSHEVAVITALLGSWFEGLNFLGQTMIGPNGEGYDGLEFSHINRNAGAESTISMLLSLERIARLPEEYGKYFSGSIELLTPAKVVEAESMRAGLSEVEVFQGMGISANAALSVKGVFSLREGLSLPPVPYSVFIAAGEVQTGEISFTLRLGDSRAERRIQPVCRAMAKIGKIIGTGQEATLTVGGKVESGRFDIDQIILLPELVALYVPKIDETVVLNFKGDIGFEKGLSSLPGRIISAERRVIQIPTVAVDLIEDGDFVHLDLSSLFNNDGIATANDRKSSNFDNPQSIFGASYPAVEIEKSLIDGKLILPETRFILNTRGNDNMRLVGQAITFVPQTCKRMCILGSANHGNYAGDAILVYEDGTTRRISVSFSDWCGGPSTGEEIAFSFPSRYDNTGNIERIKCMLYYRCVEIERKPLKSIMLPQLPNIHIFSISLTRSESELH